MIDDNAAELSKKMNVLIALALRQLTGDKDLRSTGKRNTGAGDLVHFLADFRLDAKDIAEIVGSPVTSVRTLLTPTRRK